MRRLGLFFLLLAALAIMLSACAPLVESTETQRTWQIYATFYPIYALTSLVTEDIEALETHCLVQPQDGCLRDYALSEWDLYMLLQADVVVSGGRGLESFESTLQSLGDNGPIVVFANYNYELYNQDDASVSDEESSHLEGANPHLYLSVAGAKYILESAAVALIELYPQYAEQIRANMEAADARLDELGVEMRSIAAGAAGQRAILMNETLVYLAEDLGFEIAGQYDRESGQQLYENEVEGCLEQLAEMDARVVLIEKQAPASLVETLEEAGYAVARVDVLSTLREDQGAEGYFAAQLENARAIAVAFAQAEGEN